MYGKVFVQMYDGTLGTKGPWEALVTFQQLIVLADKNGIVDMTPEAISRRTTIPLEVIQRGLQRLQEADPDSRTPDEEGKRITLLNDSRAWGWRVVNYGKYRNIRSGEERQDYHRAYWHKRKDKTQQTQPPQPEPTKAVSSKQEVEASKEKPIVGLVPDTAQVDAKKAAYKNAVEILTFFNEKAGKHFPPDKNNIGLIVGLLMAGYPPDRIRQVVAKKVREWKGDPEMVKYLRPATLFGPKNFSSKYVGEVAP